MDGLPQEIHDNIAAHLPPRSKINLADTSHALRAAYQPHVEWSALLHQVEEPSQWESPPLFERRSGNPWHPHTDADIEQRLRAFLEIPPHVADGPAPSTVRNMPVEDKATALIYVLQNAFGEQGPGLRQVALDLTRPHVEDLPANPRKRVISAMAARSQSARGDEPNTRWCLDILERKGASGNGAAVARLASSVRLQFADDQECIQTFARFDGLARKLDQEKDPGGQWVRLSLASIYQTMPDPVDSARLLIASVAGRPARGRADVYGLLARHRTMDIGIPARAALSLEQREELVEMLDAEAASLPDEMRDEIIDHWRPREQGPAADE